MVWAGIGETRDLGPCLARIHASPKPVSAPRAQVQDATIVWVDGQSLAHAAPRHVAAHFEGQVNPLESAALVGGTENRAVLARPLICVRSHREVNALRIARIDGNALHTAEIPVGEADPIEQGNPAA